VVLRFSGGGDCLFSAQAGTDGLSVIVFLATCPSDFFYFMAASPFKFLDRTVGCETVRLKSFSSTTLAVLFQTSSDVRIFKKDSNGYMTCDRKNNAAADTNFRAGRLL
jgi:hypothetical protein